eukprot:CAMPEP_0114555754 /NCGR_PEP_ID=MMETSP0114-20121206/8922_1 /TAXON_ID=31324 /ORGANISM="Goniomonas sp, Strain m" /LENGTH=196 /DNA_ID=CAMNT_0001740909 /DNA_START=66 /DNA_END=656 /DNA_ORIENTATION=+
MATGSMTNENIPPSVVARLMKEVRDYFKSPVEGIALIFNEENVTDLRAEIEGPVGTPYEGGLFRMRLCFGADFPSAPPKGFFTTQIFHPNVSKNGEICVNTLKRDWKADHTIKHIFQVLRCLLIEPNPESALNEEAGRLLLEEFDMFAQRARMMTSIHAAPKAVAVAGDDDSSPKKRGIKGGEKKKLERKRSLKRL